MVGLSKKRPHNHSPFLAKNLINTIKLRCSRAINQLSYRPKAHKVHKYSGHSPQKITRSTKKHIRAKALQSSSMLLVSSSSLVLVPSYLESSSSALSPSRFPSALSSDISFIRISSLLFLSIHTLIVSSKVLQVSFSSSRIPDSVVESVGFYPDVMTISRTCFPINNLQCNDKGDLFCMHYQN